MHWTIVIIISTEAPKLINPKYIFPQFKYIQTFNNTHIPGILRGQDKDM